MNKNPIAQLSPDSITRFDPECRHDSDRGQTVEHINNTIHSGINLAF